MLAVAGRVLLLPLVALLTDGSDATAVDGVKLIIIGAGRNTAPAGLLEFNASMDDPPEVLAFAAEAPAAPLNMAALTVDCPSPSCPFDAIAVEFELNDGVTIGFVYSSEPVPLPVEAAVREAVTTTSVPVRTIVPGESVDDWKLDNPPYVPVLAASESALAGVACDASLCNVTPELKTADESEFPFAVVKAALAAPVSEAAYRVPT
jgi:hypothetical protein